MQNPIRMAFLFSLIFITNSLLADKIIVRKDAEKDKTNHRNEAYSFACRAKISEQAKEGKKSYIVSGRKTAVLGKEFKIDPEKYYTASVWVKALGDKPSYAYLGIMPLDKYNNYIRSRHFTIARNSFTELATPCKPYDTLINIKNAARWKNSKRCVVAFFAKKDRSDLPNRNVSSPIKNIKKKDKFYEVSLSKPVGRELPTGTKVREHYLGNYI